MRVKVEMPKLSDSMAEGAVTAWFKKEGESVSEGEAIAELETEKSTVDLQSPATGVLATIVVAAGSEKVAVGTVLAEIETEAQAAESKPKAAAPPAQAAAAKPAAQAPQEAAPPQGGSEAPAGDAAATRSAAKAKKSAAPKESRGSGEQTSAGQGEKRLEKKGGENAQLPERAPSPPAGGDHGEDEGESAIAATPLARRMAAQSGIALASLEATGLGGKICKADVEAALGRANRGATLSVVSSRPAATVLANRAAAARMVEAPPRGKAGGISRVRRTIAERMTRAKATIPHFYLSVDCRVDRLLDVRERLKADGLSISVNDFVIRACALALLRVPDANASWTDEGGITQHDRVDIAVAVALDEGLVTPVLRGADQLGLGAIGEQVRELAARARDGKLAPNEYDGATFTISNLGMHGVGTMYAIINPPQACILGVGAAEARPVVEDGKVVAGMVMTLSISADHRVLDGTTGARLLAEVRRLLEEPTRMLV